MSVSDALSASDSVDYDSQNSSWYNFTIEDVLNKIAIALFQAASYLTDPICKSHEYYRRIDVVDARNPMASAQANLARKIALYVGVVCWAFLAVFTTLPGIALRAMGSYLQTHPFTHMQGEAAGKILSADRSFTLFSWNICCVGGGYSITDGGVVPWSFRIDGIVNKIIEKDADVNCLYETFDLASASYICARLQQSGYGHFYYNIGPKAIGVSSGILVASKYHINNPEFTLFPQDTLVGRTKNAAKGVFAFNLESQGENFTRIYATHLQHSEEPQFPTDEEVEARRRQMEIVVERVNTVRDLCIVVTGDLNLDEGEYNDSSWHARFQKGEDFGPIDKTWKGDEFCARLMEKQSSGPLTLDYTMVVNGAITTSLVDPGYHPAIFQEGALSDHGGLLSRIFVQSRSAI